jgi:hypothetical protein
MDWFERITGFREGDYASTQARLTVEGDDLVSRADGRRHRIGRLEVVTLQALRDRRAVAAGPATAAQRKFARPAAGRTTVRCLAGDARALHALPAFAGATFQVASQFNLLEMVGPDVTPEDGVTRYIGDRTQGPACAIAAGAGTIYRNYLVPVDGVPGQTADRQIDALAPLGRALAGRLGRPVSALWHMRNGYALCTPDGLAAICHALRQAEPATIDALRGELAVGVHWDVAVTDVAMTDSARSGTHADARPAAPPCVTQVYCSALPVAYSGIAAPAWAPFGRLVLEAAYEASLLAAAEQRSRGGSPTVLLTRLGGGAFGNPDDWIDGAIQRALQAVEDDGLDVRLVSHGTVHPAMRRIESAWQA